MEAADEATKPNGIPLRAAFLRSFTCRELSNCMRSVGAGTPKGHKEELIASISQACSESLMHERVCHHLAGQLSFAYLRRWLGQQQVDGKRVQLIHMGRNKADFVLNFIRIAAQAGRSTVLSGVARPACASTASGCAPQPHSMSQSTMPAFNEGSPSCAPPFQLVALDGEAAPGRLRSKLGRMWRKAARKVAKKIVKSRRQETARLISSELRACVQHHNEATVGEIRAHVAKAVGMKLDHGHARIFFNKQLLKTFRRGRRKKRASKVVLSESLAKPRKKKNPSGTAARSKGEVKPMSVDSEPMPKQW